MESQRVELRIDSLAARGEGVGRAPDGRVVFVPFTAPGDRVRVRLSDVRSSFARGTVEELIEPGPARRDPVCAVFGSCGGCTWQHVDYEVQLAAKARILADALTRLGGLGPCEPPKVVPSPAAYGYRARTRVWVERGRVGYRRRRSRSLCATARCPVLEPALEAKLAHLSAQPPSRSDEWELACASGEVRATPLGRRRRGGRLHLKLAGEEIAFSPGVFVQSNPLLLETLTQRLLANAGEGCQALELFAGAGFLTLPLARRFRRLLAIESGAAAVDDLRANLQAAGLSAVEVRRARVESELPGLAGMRPDVVVLDPPRTGLPRGAAAALAEVCARRIVYLSCDPATLARDVSVLAARGYRMVGIEAFDLFPQTPHVEALVALERADGGA